MSNGFRSFYEYFSNEAGMAGSINTNLFNEDTFVIIPLYASPIVNGINLSLTFSVKDYQTATDFGKGARINYCNSLTVTSNKITMNRSDFGTDDYIWRNDKSDWYNSENRCSIKKELSTQKNVYYYNIKSLNDDVIQYRENKLFGPERIKLKHGKLTEFTYNTNNKLINISYNNDLDEVAFERNSNNFISKITIRRSSTIIEEININYDSNQFISNITSQIKKTGETVFTIIRNTNYNFNIQNTATDSIIISDEITDIKVKWELTKNEHNVPYIEIKTGYDNNFTGAILNNVYRLPTISCIFIENRIYQYFYYCAGYCHYLLSSVANENNYLENSLVQLVEYNYDGNLVAKSKAFAVDKIRLII